MGHRKAVWVAGVNAADKGVNGVVEKFLIEPPDDKLSDAFLYAIPSRLNKRCAQHGEFGFVGKKFRTEEAQRRTRHCNGATITNHIARLGFGIGIKAAVFDGSS